MTANATTKRSRPPLIYLGVGAAVGGALSTLLVFCPPSLLPAIAAMETALLAALGYIVGRHDEILSRDAHTDLLTGLGTRAYFARRCAEEVDRSLRHHQPLALIVLDIDQLRELNERGGRRLGDLAIRLVAEAVRTACRSTDIVARFGGDEMSVVTPSTTARQAATLAHRIEATLRMLASATRGCEQLQISIGIAELTQARSFRSAALFHAATDALRMAKLTGRHIVVLNPGRPVDGIRLTDNHGRRAMA